ncbi:hypothetical protein [Pseudomonas fragi]|uniref:hypothetical protein n=1 Tax=Pseudomonas fragi TaxID=296 RepID=UPI002D783230|nr:hypothetical protein [Pseudomonas fragi]WRT62634.1 hypothetical protein VK847_10065 [Pseudomonas fragi]
MVMAYGFNPGESILAAKDSDGNLLCCAEHLDNLFSSGHKFAALVSQMAMVEAALHLHAKAVIQINGLAIVIPKKATFGTIKKIVVDNELIADAVVIAKLDSYVADRNDLAHNIIVRFASADLDASYKVGTDLISFFCGEMFSEVLAHN